MSVFKLKTIFAESSRSFGRFSSSNQPLWRFFAYFAIVRLMSDVKSDLARLLPLLVEAWRRESPLDRRGGRGLTPAEIMETALKVRELSRGLTRGRKLAGGGYFDEPAFLGAYLLHFWPASYVQARMLLRDTAGRVSSALDLGSGPGALSLALLDSGAERVIAADRSERSLAAAESVARSAGFRLHTEVWDALGPGPLPEGSFELVTFGHLLNELWKDAPDRLERRAGLVEKAAERLAPGGRILVIEPALMDTARDLLRLRDLLVGRGFRVLRPCIFQGPCPALPDATCHAEFDWNPPGLVKEIARRSRVSDRDDVKAAYLLLDKTSRPDFPSEASEGTPYRVVSEGMLSKSGRLRYLVCGAGGRFPLSAKKADLPARIEGFLRLKRGDLVAFAKTERRENGLGLTAESELRILERRGDLS